MSNLYNNIKKFAYIINEGFNFDEELDDSEENVISTISDSMIDRLYNVQSMVAKKIDAKYVLLNHLHFDLDLTDLNLDWNYYAPFKETAAKLEILQQLTGTFIGVKIDLVLTNNNWIKTPYHVAVDIPEIKNVVHAYGECYRAYFQITENSENDNSNRMISVWVSPDKGMVYLTNEIYGTIGRTLLSRSGVFLLTGQVYYEKIKNRQLTPAEIYTKCLLFWKNLLKQYDESVSPTNHYKIIYDKNGYPRLMAIVRNDLIYHYVMPKCLRRKYAEGWTGRLPVKDGRVAMRKDTTDGLVEVGVFIPWELPKELCKTPMRLYSIPSVAGNFDYSKQYQEHPKNFGLIVFRLSEKGKPLFDQFKLNNYKNPKK